MAAGMDDLDNDIRRTIDDAMDDGELLPYRYQNKAKSAWLTAIQAYCSLCGSEKYSQKRKGKNEKH